MGQILLGLFAAYLLYNFIFRFLIPLIRVTRHVKKQVRDFQQAAGSGNGYPPGGFSKDAYASAYRPGNDAGYGSTASRPASSFPGGESTRKEEPTRPKKDDYIDFEEIG
jgi:hypothetical protein